MQKFIFIASSAKAAAISIAAAAAATTAPNTASTVKIVCRHSLSISDEMKRKKQHHKKMIVDRQRLLSVKFQL